MTAGAPEPTGRFGALADAYARGRPPYPASLAVALRHHGLLAAGASVVDMGCGTGLSCLPFLQAGHAVIGVEPNAPMRAQAARLAQHWPLLQVRDGRAEDTGLAAESADLYVCGQAFHWFEPGAARAEALRFLRRPARAALLWNDRVAQGSAFAEGYEALLRQHSPDYLEVRHRHDRPDQVGAFFGHARWDSLVLEHDTHLDLATLRDRLVSASYVPPLGDPRHAPMLADLERLFAATAQDGSVVMAYETRVLFGELALA
jgi:SAM-dependent methyltransferase